MDTNYAWFRLFENWINLIPSFLMVSLDIVVRRKLVKFRGEKEVGRNERLLMIQMLCNSILTLFQQIVYWVGELILNLYFGYTIKYLFHSAVYLEYYIFFNLITRIFGICNNLPHIVMLSAAGDIIDKGHRHSQSVQLLNSTQNNETCPADRGTKHCDGKQSTGIILLADILPSVLAKIFVMFWAQKVSYQLRHFCVVSLQFAALLIVAFADSYFWAIFGVVLQSIAGGVGESTLVSYSSHFSHSTTVAWTSGTGAVGILGSFLYASLTEPHLANLSPKIAFLVMLVFPIAFAVAFWMILDHSKNIFHYCKKYIVVDASSHEPKPNSNENAKVEQRPTTLWQKVCLIKPLLRWLIPLMCIYLAEYMINQGFIQLVVFDCSTGLHLSKTSQYRWFQFIYRTGSFISKSSLGLLDFPVWILYLLPVLQIGNAIFFYFEALLAFIPHILIAFVIIFVAGLYGGSSLVKTLNHIHKTVPPDVREFSLAVACTSDAVGIVMAAFAAILFHNVICSQIG